MTKNKLPKLELTWIGKDDKREALEPRILIEDSKYSYGDSENENMLIHGDNLLALKALEQEYAGKVKCIYIDPPYNTGNAFEHYDDGLEHSTWLLLMRERLELLHKLLSKDGSIWVSIDDEEQAYLKVLMDEIFGRRNFITSIIWQQRLSRENRRAFSVSHEYILLYAKDKNRFESTRNTLELNEEVLSRYKNPDNDPKGAWQSVSANAQSGHATSSQFYTLIAPNGKEHTSPNGRCWLFTKDKMHQKIENNEIWFGRDGNGVPRVKKYLSEVTTGLTPHTLWTAAEVGTNDQAKKEILSLFPNEHPFDTPKPESLIERIIAISTNKGDLVLDSFLGSGTTAAVAHKMGRKWIGVELGEHAKTHCFPRMKMVVDGTEQGGISKVQNWKGGGGFRFYSLAPSLLKEDKFGNLIINKEYNADMLAAAMAKQEGFSYNPNSETYWKQGNSSESDYIYTTTQFLTVESVEAIHDAMEEGETLLICSASFQKECNSRYANITIKKIPQMLLGRCEFAKEDYSLNIIDMPKMEEEEEVYDDFSDIAIEEKPKISNTLFD